MGGYTDGKFSSAGQHGAAEDIFPLASIGSLTHYIRVKRYIQNTADYTAGTFGTVDVEAGRNGENVYLVGEGPVEVSPLDVGMSRYSRTYAPEWAKYFNRGTSRTYNKRDLRNLGNGDINIGQGAVANGYYIPTKAKAASGLTAGTDVTGGTFTITDGTNTTSGIAYNATVATCETRIVTDITAVTSVNVVKPSEENITVYTYPPIENLNIGVGSLTPTTSLDTREVKVEFTDITTPWATVTSGMVYVPANTSFEVSLSAAQNNHYISTDNGATWSDVANLPTSESRQCIGLYNGTSTRVIGGANRRIDSSDNGVAWTNRHTGAANTLRATASNGSSITIFVGDSAAIEESTAIATWNARTADASFSGAFNGAAFGNSIFVIVGVTGEIQTSSDGQTWTERTPDAGFSGTFFGVAWCGSPVNLFVAVGGSAEIQTSPDGITWTQRTEDNPAPSNFNDVVYLDPLIVAVGEGGIVQVSYDGITWHSVPADTFVGGLNTAGVGNGRLVIGGDSGTIQTSNGVGYEMVYTPTVRRLTVVNHTYEVGNKVWMWETNGVQRDNSFAGYAINAVVDANTIDFATADVTDVVDPDNISRVGLYYHGLDTVRTTNCMRFYQPGVTVNVADPSEIPLATKTYTAQQVVDSMVLNDNVSIDANDIQNYRGLGNMYISQEFVVEAKDMVEL